MQCFGGKARIAKELVEIMLRNRKDDTWFVEPFCGGCNVTWRVPGKRIANDGNAYVAAFWKRVSETAWVPPILQRDEWQRIKEAPNDYDPALVGWAGLACSYMGLFFRGYADTAFQMICLRSIERQRLHLRGVVFHGEDYYRLFRNLPEKSIVYADPPYRNTTGYAWVPAFDHRVFWDWMLRLHRWGHTVFVSEYTAPSCFSCVWEREVDVKGNNGDPALKSDYVIKRNRRVTERLFTILR